MKLYTVNLTPLDYGYTFLPISMHLQILLSKPY
jgi:hypothetical protein